MFTKIARFALLCLIIGSFSSCNQPGSAGEIESSSSYPVDTSSLPTKSAYPSGDSEEVDTYPTRDLTSAVYQPYPEPVEFSYEEPPEVTPDSSKGSVTAVIRFKGEPLQFTTFFLADVLKSEKTGLEAATELDRSTAPRVVSNQEGLLEFNNVDPGRYGLIMAGGMNTYLLLYPGRQEAILLTVEAGKQVDLGEIDFEDLPLE